MSLDIVGRENLPNVYIKEVSVDKDTENSLHIGVVVYIKDLKDGQSRFQWYENASLRNNMKIMIVVSKSTQFNDAVVAGTYSRGFVPKHLAYVPGYTVDEVQHEIIPLQNISREQLSQEPEIVTGGKLYTFGFRRKFIVNSAQDISVFAATVLDTEQFSLEQNLDLSYANINSFHGAVVGEKVLLGGQVQYGTTMLFNGDEPWTGPVHMHNEKYMAGSKHSTVNHPLLEPRALLNTKIKDYRLSYSGKSPIQKTELRKIPVISPLYASINSVGNMRASFTLDIKKIFIQNTKYGGLLLQLDESIVNTMLSQMKINDLEIVREQVLVSYLTSPSGSPKPVASKVLDKKIIINTGDRQPYRLRTKYRYYNSSLGRERQLTRRSHNSSNIETLRSSIMEIHNSNSYNYRTFAFSDLEMNQNAAGSYRYKMSLVIKDPTKDYAKDMLLDLKSGFTSFKLYKNKAEKRINYDYLLDKTKNNFINRMKDNSWINFIDVYLKYYDLLFDAEENEIAMLGYQLVALLNPRSATLTSLGRFYAHYQYLLDYFMNYFEVSEGIFNEASKRGNVNTNPHEGKFFLEYAFPEIYNFREQTSSISFLDERVFRSFNSPDLFPSLRKTDIIQVSRRERDKYFYNNPSFSGAQIPALPANLFGALNNIEDYGVTFLSPSSITQEQASFNLSVMEQIDVLSFNRFYNNFIASAPSSAAQPLPVPRVPGSRRRQELANRRRSSFHIQVAKAVSFSQSDSALDSVLAESSAANSQKNHTTIGNNIVPFGVKNVFTNFEASIASDDRRYATSFSLAGENNVLYSLINSNVFEPELLKRIPLQMKSLIGSRYQFSRANILGSGNDLIASSVTKDLVNLLFFTLVKIEVLDGYRPNGDGEVNLKQPIWAELTSTRLRNIRKTVLCRMSFYNNQALKINRSPLQGFNIENRFFYISRSQTNDSLNDQDPLTINREGPLSAILSVIENANEFPIEYAQSVLIVQSNNKNGPLKFIDYGIQRQQNEASNDFTKPSTEVSSPPSAEQQPEVHDGEMPGPGGGTYVY